MDNCKRYSEALPKKQECYSNLNIKDITDIDYKYCNSERPGAPSYESHSKNYHFYISLFSTYFLVRKRHHRSKYLDL